MNQKYFPYGRQNITEEDIEAVTKVLRSDFLTQGPEIASFEEALSKSLDSKYAVCFNSGTSALHAAYYAIGLEQGDEVITTPMTFAATSNAALYLNAKPVFADIEPDTGNIDPNKIQDLITSKTKLISAVHFAGHPVDLSIISDIAKKNNLFLIEDACHAIGSSYNGEKTGNCKYSDMTILSFHPVKHIAIGEGGAITTNNPEFYRKLKLFRSHGITNENLIYKKHGDWYYEMQELGYNYRMMDYQAALGISQLMRLQENINRRREIAQLYNQYFYNNNWFDLPPEKEGIKSSYHLYHIRLKEDYVPYKKEIFSKLREAGLGVQTHYIPVYMHPFYRMNGYKHVLCPVAEKFYLSEISIPMYPALSNDDIKIIVERIKIVFDSFDSGK